MKRIKNKIFISIIILAGALFQPSVVGRTQSGTAWSDPLNISNMLTDSAYPTIVADASGVVHVFWAENSPEYGDFNNLIYYTRFDGQAWTQPVDVLSSPQGLQVMADQPTAAIGDDGKIHLVFVSGWNGQIYYSAAYAQQAMNARAWQEPILLSSETINCSAPDMAIDKQGIIHVVYPVQFGNWQGIYHVSSRDNGKTWDAPNFITGTSLGVNTIIDDVRMAISPDGTVHIVWMWTNANEVFPPKGIYYVHSNKGDWSTWSDPYAMVNGPYRNPDIAVVGESRVVFVWSGTAEDRYKFSQWSPDNGISWSSITKIPHLGGFQGYPEMAQDGQGNLHLGMVASDSEIHVGSEIHGNDALIHSVWSEQGWSEPEVPLENNYDGQNPQNASIAISEGNILNMVVMYPVALSDKPAGLTSSKKYQFDIYYVRGVLPSSHISPHPLPPIPTPTNPMQATPNSQSTQQENKPAGSLLKPLSDNGLFGYGLDFNMAILAGGVPVVILLLAMILLKWKQKS